MKKKLPLLISLVIFAGALGALGFLEFRDLRRMKDAAAAKQAQDEELNKFVNALIAPTPGNSQSATENVRILEQAFGQLSASLGGREQEFPKMETLEFDSHFHARFVAPLRRLAAEQKVALPADFAFGFSTCAKQLQPVENIQPLLRQMDIVTNLCELLMGSGVVEIHGIRRVPVEPLLKQQAAAGQLSGFPDLWNPEPRERAGVYEAMPFELEFVANTTALQTFLNKLADSHRTNRRLFLVREIRTATGLVEGSIAGQPSIRPSGTPTAAGSVEHRLLVTGEDKVRFRLRVDWIKVVSKALPAEPKSAGEAPPNAPTVNPPTAAEGAAS